MMMTAPITGCAGPEDSGIRARRRRTGADLRPLAQHVVRDLEHGQRRDARREPREPHQRHAQDQRHDAADQRREHERGDVAERVIAQDREEIGQDAGLGLDRDRHEPRGEPADGHEADLPERQHARVADEDVDRHDHRDRDDRIEEIELVGEREPRADEADDDDEHDRAEQLEQGGAAAAHTRSTTEERPRTNSPAGRSSRTRITRANTTDGR